VAQNTLSTNPKASAATLTTNQAELAAMDARA